MSEFKRRFGKRLVMFVLAAAMLFSLSGGGVLAQDSVISLTVSPPKTEMALSPGDQADGTVSVTNLSSQTMDVHVYITDFTVDSNTGTVTLQPPNSSNPYGLGSYITINSADTFYLAMNEQHQIGFHVKIPSQSGGGSRFGAIVFSSGPPPESGKVTLVQEIASLIVVRVNGAVVTSLPTSSQRSSITLPVKAAQGTKIVQLNDPGTNIQIQQQAGTVKMSLPVSDTGGTQQGTLYAQNKDGATGNGDSATLVADRMWVQSNIFSVSSPGNQTAQGQVSFDVTSLPQGSVVSVKMSSSADQAMQAAIDAVAGQSTTKVGAVMNVAEQNIQDQLHIVNSSVQMGVSREWTDANDISLVRIVRYADNGSVQVLDTRFLGYNGNIAVFQANSPEGLGSFALVAFSTPTSPTELPAGTVPPRDTTMPEDAQNVFKMVLTFDVSLSSQATATDSQGQAAAVDSSKSISMSTNFVPPSIDSVELNLARSEQSGTLQWVKPPKIALSGHIKLTLRFANTGNADYDVNLGKSSVISTSGKTADTIQVSNFTITPNTSHDIALDWETSSSAMGRYTIAAQVTYGDPTQMAISQPISVIVLPWKWLITIVWICVGLVAIIWLAIRTIRDQINRRVEERTRERLANGDSNGNSGGSPPQSKDTGSG